MRKQLLLLALVPACATGSSVNLDETSAQGHRSEAQRERAVAAEHQSLQGPVVPREMGEFRRLDSTGLDHAYAGEFHRKHAQAHEEAARELERFEAAECSGVPFVERAGCPFLGPVTRRSDLPDGVRLELASKASIEAVVVRMRCHYAFARAHGFTLASAACPLYIRGIEIRQSSDFRAIEIRGSTPQVIREIRQRVRSSL